MRGVRFRMVLALAALAAVLLVPVAQRPAAATPADGAAASTTGDQSLSTVQLMGHGNLRAASARDSAQPAGPRRSARPRHRAAEAQEERAARSTALPNPAATPVVASHPGVLSRLGITASADVRIPHQLAGEPPDQGLCVGNGYVVEVVNQAVGVYDRSGRLVMPLAGLNDFYGLVPEYRPQRQATWGPDLFDPSCVWDSDVRRWFVVVDGVDLDPYSGAFAGGTHLFLAVSRTADPTGDYTFFSITTTFGDRLDRGCPCIDDFPKSGWDANGLYITANRFSWPSFSVFNRAYVHAIPKRPLVAAADGARVRVNLVNLRAPVAGGQSGFSLMPAITAPGSSHRDDREYFLSTLAEFATGRSVILWALSNTASLANARPNVRLSYAALPSLLYVVPRPATQKPGPRPLGRSLKLPTPRLDSGNNDNRQQVTYVNGRLWTTIGTAVQPAGGKARTGVLWVEVTPHFANGRIGGAVTRQGYLAVAVDSVLYPAVTMNVHGRGAMVFSLAGPGVYPSAAYVAMTSNGPTGPIHLAASGVAPEDGFTCYPPTSGEPGDVCRWGDYSQSVVDETGDIWMATEYIPAVPRASIYVNWGTRLLRLHG